MNFSFWPFFWFGLAGRLLKKGTQTKLFGPDIFAGFPCEGQEVRYFLRNPGKLRRVGVMRGRRVSKPTPEWRAAEEVAG